MEKRGDQTFLFSLSGLLIWSLGDILKVLENVGLGIPFPTRLAFYFAILSFLFEIWIHHYLCFRSVSFVVLSSRLCGFQFRRVFTLKNYGFI
jgi:hypothetical protein